VEKLEIDAVKAQDAAASDEANQHKVYKRVDEAATQLMIKLDGVEVCREHTPQVAVVLAV